MKSVPRSWTSYRKRNWLAVGLLLGGLPLAVALAIATRVVFHLEGDAALILAVLAWCCAWGCAAIRVVRWPCPRCGAGWLASQEARLGAPRRCAKCGLGLYEEP